MNFTEAVKSGFSRYTEFPGRSIRSEFWYFTLFVFVGQIICSILDGAISGGAMSDTLTGGGIGLVEGVFVLGTIIPSLAVSVRRLHDIDRTGWWILIVLTIIGILLLLYWYCQPGSEDKNRFGPASGSNNIASIEEH